MGNYGTVRSGTTGRLIPCCFNDCDRTGCDRYEHNEFIAWLPVPGGGIPQYRIYLFCSERHRALWRHSHLSLGNLPTGSKGIIT